MSLQAAPKEAKAKPASRGKPGARHTGKTTIASARRLHAAPFDGEINSIARSGDTLYAATSDGLLKSVTAGTNWALEPDLERQSWRYVAAARSMAAVASLNSLSLTIDGGKKWRSVSLPPTVKQLAALAVDGAGGLWVGGREGVFFSEDEGATWNTIKRLAIHDVTNLFYDGLSQRILITANNQNTIVYAVHLPDKAVKYWNAGWSLRLARPVGDHLVAATLFDGIVVQPRMVASKEVSANTEASANPEPSAKHEALAKP